MKIVSKSIEETRKIAGDFLKILEKNSSNAQIVGLIGDLGAGKTAFVQKVGELLGIKEPITSPTFVIMKIYNNLIHIDAYRLKNGEELRKLNFAELASNPKNLILIEWPENVASALPENYRKIYFKFIDEKTREISF